MRWRNRLKCDGEIGCFYSSANSSYADATGAGANYVYLVDAADDRGNVRELQLIFFGRESDGEGWLEIEARGGSGARYHACDAAESPSAARRALDR